MQQSNIIEYWTEKAAEAHQQGLEQGVSYPVLKPRGL